MSAAPAIRGDREPGGETSASPIALPHRPLSTRQPARIGFPDVTRAAPRRSARLSAATIRSRSPATSSSVSVRSGAWKARWSATDFRPSPTCVALVDVEEARLAELRAGRLVRRGDERADLDVLADRDGDVLPVGRVGDHVVVEDPLGDGRHQRLDVELEDAPAPLEERRVELAEPARVRLRRLAGMQVVERRAPRRRAGCGTPRRSPRRPPAPPRSRPRRSRRRASAPRGAARPRSAGTRARARRGGRRRVARVDVDARRLDEAREQRRPQDGVLAAHRLGQPQRRAGRGRSAVRLHVYASEKPAPTSTSSSVAAEPLLGRQVAGDGAAEGHRVRDPVEHRPRDLLDEVDLARHVAGTPRRDGHLPRRRSSKPRPPRIARCSSSGTSSPIRRRARSGRSVTSGRGREARRGRRRGRRARRPRGRRAAGSRAPRPARPHRGRRPSPTCSSPPCAARARSEVRSTPIGSKFAASSSTSVVCVLDLRLEPAHDRGERDRPLAVRDQEVARQELALRSRRASAGSRPVARGGRRCGRRRASRGRTRGAGSPRRA